MRRRDFLQSALVLTAAGLVNPTHLLAAATGGTDSFTKALAEHPWLLGFDTAAADTFDTAQLTVEGSLPADLRGSFYRNGPAKHVVGNMRYHHWFDGDGMVQAFHFTDTGVSHIGRFVETDKYRRETQAGKPLVWGFGTTPAGTLPPQSPAEVNAANINALPHAGRLLALWEAGDAYALDPKTLETHGPHYWSEETAGLPFSAHPRVEPDGTLWNFGLAPYRNMLILYHISPQGQLKQRAGITLENAGMVHDFLVTEHHVVVVIPPLVLDPEKTTAGQSFLDSHVWQPKLGTRVLVIDKTDLTKRQVFELPPSFTFHYGNAWEESAGIIRFDACRRRDASALFGGLRSVMHGGEFSQGAPPECTLVTVDLKKRIVTQIAVFDANHIIDGPLAVARLPYWLPLGFHGNFALTHA